MCAEREERQMRVGRGEEQRKEKTASDHKVPRPRHYGGVLGWRVSVLGSPCQDTPRVRTPSASHITIRSLVLRFTVGELSHQALKTGNRHKPASF